MNQNTPNRRIKETTTIGGVFVAMKGQKQFGDVILHGVLKMKAEAKSNREISEFWDSKINTSLYLCANFLKYLEAATTIS